MKKRWLRMAARILIPLLLLMMAGWSALSNQSPFAPLIANLFLDHTSRVSTVGTPDVADSPEQAQEDQQASDASGVTNYTTESAVALDLGENPAEADTASPSDTPEEESQEGTDALAEIDTSAPEACADEATDTAAVPLNENSGSAEETGGASVLESPTVPAPLLESTSASTPEPAPVVVASPSPVVDAVVVECLSSEVPSQYVTARAKVFIRGTIRLSPITPEIPYPITVRVGIKPWPVGYGDSYGYTLESGQRELSFEMAAQPMPEGASAYKVMADIPPYWKGQNALEDFTQVPFGYEGYGSGAKSQEWAKSMVIRPAGDRGIFGPVSFVLGPLLSRSISGIIFLPEGEAAPAGGLWVHIGASGGGSKNSYGNDYLIPEGSNSIPYKLVLAAELAGEKSVLVFAEIPKYLSGGEEYKETPYSDRAFYISPAGTQLDPEKAVPVEITSVQDLAGIDFRLSTPEP